MTSDRFKPIQKIAENHERKAAAAFGESLRARQAAERQLQELQGYHKEYLVRFEKAINGGLTPARLREYQVFIDKLENAIRQQQDVLAEHSRHCEVDKRHWQGRYTKSKALDVVVERMRQEERQREEKREQAQTDERNQRRR